jgi:CRP-like cAMP-binding protein
LASLSRPDLYELLPLLKFDSLVPGAVIYEPGEQVEQIYFPYDGMISLLVVMRDGRTVETASVGSEGVLGAMAAVGLHKPITKAEVQLPLLCSKIATPAFRRTVRASETLQNMVTRANDALFVQVQITAACNTLHPLEQRLARWLLWSSKRMRDGLIPLTQELLSQSLGVTRSSVSEVAGRFQSTSLIRYVRGHIEIVNRPALQKLACECYENLGEEAIFR